MSIQALASIAVVMIGLILGGVDPGFAEKEDKEMIVARGNNLFAVELYAQLATQETANIFFSPYSIFTALSMTYAGARNVTEEQIAGVLHLELGQQPPHQAIGTWMTALNISPDAQESYQLYTANAFWGQQDYKFLCEFLELLTTYYGAQLTTLDFANNPQEAGQTINLWVEQHTQGKITDLIDPQTLDQSTTLVLTNAIYFKGQWVFPFDPQNTKEVLFSLISGDKVEVPMMYQTLQVDYFEDDTIQVLELPYGHDERETPISMVLFLPKEPAQLTDLEAKFSAEYLQETLAKLHEQTVMVGIPKFTVSGKFSLPEVLAALGMNDAFSPQRADFSGMTGKKELYISDVLHKVFIEVNEEGSEAAGATAVTMSRGLMRHPVFQADHPFLMLIRDTRTQGMLFLGRVMDPRG